MKMRRTLFFLFLAVLPAAVFAQSPKAIWCEGNATLYFVYDSNTYTAGDTYTDDDGIANTITNVYSAWGYYTNLQSRPFHSISTSVEYVDFQNSFKGFYPVNMNYYFNSFTKMKEMKHAGNLSTDNVTSFAYTFQNCPNITTIDVSNWNTSNVTTFQRIFTGCCKLAYLDVKGWNTRKATNLWQAFASTNLRHLTFGKDFSIDKVPQNAALSAFQWTNSLRYIDFSDNDNTDLIKEVNRNSNLFAGVNRTTVIYLPHGSTSVTNAENVVYSYNGDETDLRCPKYYSEDKTEVELPYAFRTNEAVYTRTMGNNNYGSVILPYDFTSNENIQAYTLDDEYPNQMFFKNTTTVAAHTPFAFKRLSTGTTADFTMTDTGNAFGITVNATRSTNASEDTWTDGKGSPYTTQTNLDGWTAKGYYENESVAEYDGAFYIASDKFYKADGALTMYPHRVTFHGRWTKGGDSAGVRALGIQTDDELVTAIDAAEASMCEASEIYNAQGHRLPTLRRGVNIVRMSDGTVRKIIRK